VAGRSTESLGVISVKLAISLGIVGLLASSAGIAKVPDCTGPEHWPASTAYVRLKDRGVLSSETVVFERVTSVRVASEKIGADLWRQVHRVRFPLKNKQVVQVLTVSDASSEECSMGDVDVFLVSRVVNKR
jgi:hypothetical protein